MPAGMVPVGLILKSSSREPVFEIGLEVGEMSIFTPELGMEDDIISKILL